MPTPQRRSEDHHRVPSGLRRDGEPRLSPARGGELLAHRWYAPEEAHGGGDTRPACRQAAGNALADQVADGEPGGKLAPEQGGNAKPPAAGVTGAGGLGRGRSTCLQRGANPPANGATSDRSGQT